MFPDTSCNDCNENILPPVPLPNLSQVICGKTYNSDCVIYNGDDVSCLGIESGMPLTDVFQSLLNSFCDCCAQPTKFQPALLNKTPCGLNSDVPIYELVYIIRNNGVFSNTIAIDDVVYLSDQTTKYDGDDLFYGIKTLNSTVIKVVKINNQGVIIALHNPTPIPDEIDPQTFCNAAILSDLEIVGTSIKVYDEPYNGTPLLPTAVLSTATYYATQTLNNCESASRPFSVIVNGSSVPTATTPQVFCTNATIANLVATGTAIKWYATLTGGTPLISTTPLVSGTTYYASQTISGCESARRAVLYNFGLPLPPVAAPQTFCSTSNATVASLVATGTAIKWYAALTGGTQLASNTTLVNNTTYYASQTVGSCESTRTYCFVTFSVTPPVLSGSKDFCYGVTIADLKAFLYLNYPTNQNIKVYLNVSGGSELPNTTTIPAGLHTYYYTQTINGCEGPRIAGSEINVAAPVSVPTFDTPQTFCLTSKISDIIVSGSNIKWYAAATGGTALATSTILTTGNYYLTQTINGCESNRASISIVAGQDWLSKNLDVITYSNGRPIPQVTDPTAWANLTTGAWCYFNNDSANNTVYGKLYNWYAVAGIYDAASLANPGSRLKLAPEGYHVPTNEEWTILSNCLGGGLVSGGKLKEAGTTHWQSPNVGATNSSGFTALPSAGRNGSSGSFDYLGSYGYYWTSTEITSISVAARYLSFTTEYLYSTENPKNFGLAVRCVKD